MSSKNKDEAAADMELLKIEYGYIQCAVQTTILEMYKLNYFDTLNMVHLKIITNS